MNWTTDVLHYKVQEVEISQNLVNYLHAVLLSGRYFCHDDFFYLHMLKKRNSNEHPSPAQLKLLDILKSFIGESVRYHDFSLVVALPRDCCRQTERARIADCRPM